MGKLAMIAFGGNALLRAGQKGSFAEQMENVELTCSQLIPLVEQGCDLVIGHGNGPQVGNAQLRHKACKDTYGLEAMPLDFCVAETQGSIAYMIETAMEYALNKAGLDKRVASIVTRVSAYDPAFDNPSKPVGPYFTAAEAAAMPWVNWKEDPQGRGFRKVVPSPEPLRINNIDLVEDLARHGCIVVTCGGGGIPVLNDGRGHHGVEAVIDKDLASALAAVQMRDDDFYILTDISCTRGRALSRRWRIRRGVDGSQGEGRSVFREEWRIAVCDNRGRAARESCLWNANNTIISDRIWHSI